MTMEVLTLLMLLATVVFGILNLRNNRHPKKAAAFSSSSKLVRERPHLTRESRSYISVYYKRTLQFCQVMRPGACLLRDMVSTIYPVGRTVFTSNYTLSLIGRGRTLRLAKSALPAVAR